MAAHPARRHRRPRHRLDAAGALAGAVRGSVRPSPAPARAAHHRRPAHRHRPAGQRDPAQSRRPVRGLGRGDARLEGARRRSSLARTVSTAASSGPASARSPSRSDRSAPRRAARCGPRAHWSERRWTPVGRGRRCGSGSPVSPTTCWARPTGTAPRWRDGRRVWRHSRRCRSWQRHSTGRATTGCSRRPLDRAVKLTAALVPSRSRRPGSRVAEPRSPGRTAPSPGAAAHPRRGRPRRGGTDRGGHRGLERRWRRHRRRGVRPCRADGWLVGQRRCTGSCACRSDRPRSTGPGSICGSGMIDWCPSTIPTPMPAWPCARCWAPAARPSHRHISTRCWPGSTPPRLMPGIVAAGLYAAELAAVRCRA